MSFLIYIAIGWGIRGWNKLFLILISFFYNSGFVLYFLFEQELSIHNHSELPLRIKKKDPRSYAKPQNSRYIPKFNSKRKRSNYPRSYAKAKPQIFLAILTVKEKEKKRQDCSPIIQDQKSLHQRVQSILDHRNHLRNLYSFRRYLMGSLLYHSSILISFTFYFRL